MWQKLIVIFFVFLLSLLVFLLCVWIFVEVAAEKRIAPVQLITIKSYERGDYNLDSLRTNFGWKKEIPEVFELSILLALSHFPEFKDLKIKFEITQSGAPLESTFSYGTLFRSVENRKYRILLLDSYGSNFDPILMRNLSLDSQIGIVSHELCHTNYYHDLSTIEIIKWGLQYILDGDFDARHERSSDFMTIYKGFGWQLLDYAEYIRTAPGMKEWYESGGNIWLDKYYMTQDEIIDVMDSMREYSL